MVGEVFLENQAEVKDQLLLLALNYSLNLAVHGVLLETEL